MNSIGRVFKLTDFGDTYSKAFGGIIEGCPPNVFVDLDFIQQELARRAPSNHPYSTQRKESDRVEFLSGIENGRTTGAPIGFTITNEEPIENPDTLHILKPSHASYTYKMKYGAADNSSCGRASARQTVVRVVAGALAKLILSAQGISIEASVLSVGTPCEEGDSFGAKVGCRILNVPAGLGEPVYDKFHARLGYAMLSINAAKGFEIGEGFEAANMSGLQYNDRQKEDFSFLTNHDGGVQAGITNGEDIYFNVAFKPIPSIRCPQDTINFDGSSVTYTGNHRNDLCVAPRVLPVVEAMAALTTLDFLLISKNI